MYVFAFRKKLFTYSEKSRGEIDVNVHIEFTHVRYCLQSIHKSTLIFMYALNFPETFDLKAKERRKEIFANLKSFWQCCLFCKESQLLHDSKWNGRWMKSSLLNVCFMHDYKSNTPFSVKWLSYTFLAPSYVGIQIVREINTKMWLYNTRGQWLTTVRQSG